MEEGTQPRPEGPKRGETKIPPKPKSVNEEELHRSFMEEFDECVSIVKDDRDRMDTEVNFIHKRGGQWDDWARKVRGDRPRPEVNLLVKKLESIKGDQKQSRITAKVRATGSGARERIAEVFDGLVRATTANRMTKSARDAAFDEAVDCGLGAYLIDYDYESDTSFSIEPTPRIIRNARQSVYWTCDGADLQHRADTGCYLIDNISRKEAKRRWPKAKAPNENFMGKNGPWKGWSTKTHIRICDHWRREPYTRTLGQFRDEENNEFIYEIDPETDQILDELSEEGIELVRKKQVISYKVMKYVLSGSEILEGPTECPSPIIPVCTVYAYGYFDDKGFHPYGAATHAIDAQRKLNYEVGATMEASAKAAKDPYLATEEQIRKHSRQWKTLGAQNPEYLLYTADPQAQSKAPFRSGAPAMQSALLTQMQDSENFIRGTTGVHDVSVGANPKQQSGVAVARLQAKGDSVTYGIKDGLAAAVSYETECLISAFPVIYDRETTIRILKDDDETEDIKIVREVVDKETGNVVSLKDFRLERYDVTVDIGPSYATKRLENLDVLTQLGGQIPIFNEFGADIIAGELDITKSRELKERIENFMIMSGKKIPSEEKLKELVEGMQKQQMLQQALQPQNQASEQQLNAMRLQEIKFENEALKDAADVDKAVSDRVKSLSDSVQTMLGMPQTMERDAAIAGIYTEIQQALTSNDQARQVG